MCTSRYIYKQVNLKLIPPKYITALKYTWTLYACFTLFLKMNGKFTDKGAIFLYFLGKYFRNIHMYFFAANALSLCKLKLCMVWALVDLLQLYHAAHMCTEITKVSLTLPDIRSGKDSLFTRPNRISQDRKKYQAFPAVVAFNQGLPIFHFSF